ncbi:MAG: TonB-dependent receptor [Chitinophagaceae bacterium]|nr:TonB-dependent receptor [Chitinophagaceae bacterium]
MRKLLFLLISLLAITCQSWAQAREVTGKVTDANGTALSGVSVKVKGSEVGTSTGNDGTYSIKMPKRLNSLIFSSIGFDDQEVDVKGNVVNITLSQASKNLNEVVITGYGTQVKREVTSVIARVKGSEVQNMPVADLAQTLQGRAAGVFVEAQNGKIGEGIKIRIRGASSLNGSNDPLYVVDGVPLVGGVFGSASSDINFNDVESFDILKDASAAAIYGSRAANGVILITTKRGKAGKTKFTLNTQYGVQNPTNKRGFLNAAEYIELFKEAAINTAKYHYNRAGNWRGYASEAAAITDMTTYVENRFTRYSGYSDWRTLQTDNNWEDAAFNEDARTSNIELSAQGGTERNKFYFSTGINNQDGILIANKFKRLSLRFNMDNQLNNWLKMGLNMSLSKTDRKRLSADNAFNTPMQLVAMSPITPFRNQAGVLYNTPTTTYYNGLIDVEDAENNAKGYRNQGNIYAESRIAKGLTLRNELGLDMVNQSDERFWGSRTDGGAGIGGAAWAQWFRNTRWTTNNYFNYVTTVNEKHKVDATLGMSFENRYDEYSFVEGENFADESITTLAGASTITGGSTTHDMNNLVSYFVRANYSFNRKYLLSLNARIDGDSRFGSNYKYGTFPSVSAGWIISDEEFMKKSKWLSFLKLRASYGIVGNNSGVGFYSSIPQYGSVKYGSTGAGLRITNFGNDDLRWEKVTTMDVGFEFGLFNNRLSGEFSWYNKKTTDMLLAVPTPSPSGTTSVLGNIGEMENKGIELSLNSVNVVTRNFKWTTNINAARNRNKMLKLDGEQKEILPSDARFSNAVIIGQPIGIFYGVKYAGVDPANGDPLFYEQDDKTTTNVYGDAGKFIIGDPNPDWIAGISNTITWKGLELNFLFQGVFGNQVQDGAGGFMSASADWFDNQTRDQLKRWKKPGDITNVPEARLNRFGDFDSPSMSTRFIYDATYVRLKNLTIGYNLPQNILNKAKLSNARIYVSGVNLLTFTKYPGWDPEVNTDYRAGNVNQGSDFYAAPQIKSIVVGLTVGL